jgi:AraC-like DNA-binding protein
MYAKQSENAADPLPDVLTMLNIGGAYFSRFEATGRWGLYFPAYRHVKAGAVVSGSFWLTPDAGPTLRLSAGDCYLLGPHPYEITSDPRLRPEDGSAVYRRSPDSKNVRYEGTDARGGERTVIVGGSITLDEMTSGLLLDYLPPAVRIPAGSPHTRVLRPALDMLAEETGDTGGGTLGAAVMNGNLTQILFIQTLRAYLDAKEGVPGWLRALGDPQIGAALKLMHREATRRWTVAELAAEVGMSRSTFAQRFKTFVGMTPLDYLSQWRIRSAARALLAGDRTVASVAAEWGYASESAFSNAFKRVTGHPPARYRTVEPAAPAAPPEERRAARPDTT